MLRARGWSRGVSERTWHDAKDGERDHFRFDNRTGAEYR